MNTSDTLRQQLEQIYLKYLPNPKTGLYDVKSSIDEIMALVSKAVEEARLDELESLPWKRSDKYGINTPYVTKTWLTTRKMVLKAQLAINQKGDKV